MVSHTAYMIAYLVLYHVDPTYLTAALITLKLYRSLRSSDTCKNKLNPLHIIYSSPLLDNQNKLTLLTQTPPTYIRVKFHKLLHKSNFTCWK
jgi:hypothetical protein